LTGAWQATKALKVRPASRTCSIPRRRSRTRPYHFISGYDPTYTDVRGRRFFASVNYAFK
jgi:iron complex outermembrane receptor protein